MSKKFGGVSLVVFFAGLIALSVLADPHNSARPGNWKDGGTWGGVKGSDVPGAERGKTDDATVGPGHAVNWNGKGNGKLGNVTVSGTIQGTGSGTVINIETEGNVTINNGGKVGGAGAGAPHNPVSIKAGGSVTVNGTVEGNGKKGTVKISGNNGVTVGGTGKVESKGSSVTIKSKSGSVNVNKNGQVTAKKNVVINSGKGKPTQIDGKVTSTKANVVINKGTKPPGNVTVGKDGVIDAKLEVVIYADTLYVEGKIKGKTIQKYCKTVILKIPPGSIEGKIKTTNKIDTLLVVDKSDPAAPAEQSEENKIIGEANSYIDFHAAPLAVLATGYSLVATGPGGTIDMTGNPPGTMVIECPGTIEFFSDNILLDPGVTLADICGPGPVIEGPSQPIIAVATYCLRDTVGYAVHAGEIEFVVTNAGLVPETFTITVADSLGWPYSVSVPSVALDNLSPRDSVITVTFDVPPGAVAGVDTNMFWLTATSVLDPGISYTETALIPVGDECDLRDATVAWWDSENTAPGDTALVHVLIQNTGNVFTDGYDVHVTDTNGWELIPPIAWIVLDVDQDSLYTTKVVIPPSATPGITDELYFTVQSGSCPGMVARDTVSLLVTSATAVDYDTPGFDGITHNAYPNPFNPTVNVSFTVPGAGGLTRVEVFDINGRRVKTVFEGTLGAGSHTRVWDGTNNNGDVVSSGIYMYRITVGGRTATGKIALTK